MQHARVVCAPSWHIVDTRGLANAWQLFRSCKKSYQGVYWDKTQPRRKNNWSRDLAPLRFTEGLLRFQRGDWGDLWLNPLLPLAGLHLSASAGKVPPEKLLLEATAVLSQAEAPLSQGIPHNPQLPSMPPLLLPAAWGSHP